MRQQANDTDGIGYWWRQRHRRRDRKTTENFGFPDRRGSREPAREFTAFHTIAILALAAAKIRSSKDDGTFPWLLVAALGA